MIEARDTGSPGTARKGGRDSRPDEKTDSRPKRPAPKLLFGAAAALVVVAVAVAAVVLLTGGGDEKAAAPAAKPVPAVYNPTYERSGFETLASRQADKRAITKAEAFGGDAKTIQWGDYKLTQTAAELTDCKTATWGARLQQDLAAHGCTQIGRAAYVSADKKYVGQFIVVNLKDKAGADQILRDLEPGANAGWVRPIGEQAATFGEGVNAAYARPYGHYAVIVWVKAAGAGKDVTLYDLLDASVAFEKPADFLWARLSLADKAAQ